MEVLRFLTSPEAQTELNRRWGYTPTRLSVFEDPALVAANPVLPELQQALAASVLRPLTPIYAQLSDLLTREFNAVITGAIGADPAMQELQRNSERLSQGSGAQP